MPTPAKPKLLSGGNPQIAKGEGDGPVQAYIAAMPGWKSRVGADIDAAVARIVPGVRKAVKWNTPLYGASGAAGGWFLAFHCFDKYIKVTFLRGQLLDPVPPEPSKSGDVRYFHIREGETADTAQFSDWVRQAAALPGQHL